MLRFPHSSRVRIRISSGVRDPRFHLGWVPSALWAGNGRNGSQDSAAIPTSKATTKAEWPTAEDDFRETNDLGANVARAHLQLGKFYVGESEG